MIDELASLIYKHLNQQPCDNYVIICVRSYVLYGLQNVYLYYTTF